MIVSYDTIMNPPYEITNSILKLISAISEKIGAINANYLHRPSPELRKKNRIKTIKASLEIEGNSLSEEQITAIIENKKVVGPKSDVIEAVNAIKVYDKLDDFNPGSLESFLEAHKILMENLIDNPGHLRTKHVGIFKGKEISHVAPPAKNLKKLMLDLFKYYQNSDDPILIKSCVIHYEIEFIHPFMDGNGRMGRLWQTIILKEKYPVFEFLPFETIIKERQSEYYSVLEISDKEGKSTKFIEFMLSAIDESLIDLLTNTNKLSTSKDRIEYFIEIYKQDTFSRKIYLEYIKDISTATASRDLKYGVEQKLLTKRGDKNKTEYSIKRKK